jgi:uncharacterized iron-regulated membrane protein
MTYAEQWLRRPQNVWLRRALFQVHLWTGIGLGIYIFVISLTGSALVYRNELYKHYTAGPHVVPVLEKRLTKEELSSFATRAHPGYSVSYIWESKNKNEATEVWLSRNNDKLQRLFDPFTGEDLGDSIPRQIRILKWTADLHTDLLFGPTGRIVNGIGGFFLTLICLTGIVIWWPGVKNWKRSLGVQWSANWKRLNWDLHSAAGFWTLSIVFIFGITGAYVVFTMPFQRVINFFAPLNVYKLPEEFSQAAPAPPAPFLTVAEETGDAAPKRPRRRPPPAYSFGDKIVRWSSWLHFGNFAGWKTKAVWVLLGLFPPFLFVTGAIMWWNRVLSREARRLKKRVEATAA